MKLGGLWVPSASVAVLGCKGLGVKVYGAVRGYNKGMRRAVKPSTVEMAIYCRSERVCKFFTLRPKYNAS